MIHAILREKFIMEKQSQINVLFEDFANGQNHATAFVEMLDLFLVSFQHHDTEDTCFTALKAITEHPNNLKLMAFYGELGALSEDFCDPLGELYQTYVSKGKNGQFFTPDRVADLLACLSGLDGSVLGEAVCDPACGSGRLLLAAARHNRHLRFYGADIDGVCCKMAVVNMLLQSLTGEIAHMDTLSKVFYRKYKVGTRLLHGYHRPYFIEFDDPQESYLWHASQMNKY